MILRYVTFGNHDWKGFTGPQHEYSALSKRWTSPSNYYTILYTLNDKTRVKIIMIDSQVQCDWTENHVPNTMYPIYPTFEEKENQITWLAKELENSRDDDYVFGVGHYQMHTSKEAKTCMTEIEDMISNS